MDAVWAKSALAWGCSPDGAKRNPGLELTSEITGPARLFAQARWIAVLARSILHYLYGIHVLECDFSIRKI